MRQLGPRKVEQQPAMPPFRAFARIGVRFPGLIGDDQCHLRMSAQHAHRLVGTRIVIGDDRVDLGREMVKRIGEDERLVADASHRYEPMLPPEQRLVALDDPFRVAEPPVAGSGGHLAPPVRIRTQIA
jgi:hypothetical protein